MDNTVFRDQFVERIRRQFQVHPICALLGPRQCGKTTLAQQFVKTHPAQQVHRFDLENPEDLESLAQPFRILERLQGLVIIDEIQRLPDLFPVLRVLVDREEFRNNRYLILGSASRDLIRQSSETLAGRIGFIELVPFQLAEGFMLTPLWVRGGFPRSYLAQSDADSMLWRQSYIQTFLEQDIPNLGFSVPPRILRRFWLMLTHVHAQLLNVSGLGTALGVSDHRIRQYLDILAGTFMIRILSPWFVNMPKRQTKTPKVYFRDSGILLGLMGLSSEEALLRHPNLGAIWEGFALEQVIHTLELQSEEVFFWRTHNGAELDLYTHYRGQHLGFECKFVDAPRTTKSMHSALEDLKLHHLYVVYPGKREFPLGDKITAMGLQGFVEAFRGKK